MKNKRKILIVINSDLHVRNYISTNVFKDLFTNYDVSIAFNSNINQTINSKDLLTFSSQFTNYYNKIFHYLMWNKRSLSSSFRFRIKRLHGFHLKEESSLITILRFVRYIFNYTEFFLFANKYTFPIVFYILNKISKNNSSLLNIIKQKNPDIIIYPSTAYEDLAIDILKISQQESIKSVFIIDNWDNISSKSILWLKPDKVLVWGEQTKQQAIDIQNFNEEQVEIIGSARFDGYFRQRNDILVSNFSFKYILLLGYSIPFDEVKLVYQIDKIVSKHSEIFSGIKVLYRPHPFRQGKDKVDVSILKNTIIDPQLDSLYSNNFDASPPDLNYYPSLISNAEFVISCLTSMIIETLVFKKKLLIIAYDEKNNFASPKGFYQNYVHFKELKDVTSLTFCNDFNNLEEDFLNSWKDRHKIDVDLLEKQREYFCYNDTRGFGNRLFKICEKLC